MSDTANEERPSKKKKKRSLFMRLVRTVLLAIFVAFTVGFVIGTFLRREVDKPVRYIGAGSVVVIPIDSKA